MASVHYPAAGLTFVNGWIFMITSTVFVQRLAPYSLHFEHTLNVKAKLLLIGLSTLGVFGMTCTSIAYQHDPKAIVWSIFAVFEYCFMLGFSGFCLSYWSTFKWFKLGVELVEENCYQPLLVNKA
jgi:hypothetical protein